GSFNNEIGLPLTVLKVSPDTKFAVLEMGADHPGNILSLTAIAPPNVGNVLTVGTAHMETFGTRDGIALAKSEMIDGVLPGGAAVLNLDDPRVAQMRNKADDRALHTVMYGRGEGADVRAEDVELDPLGRASFTLRVKGRVLDPSENTTDFHAPVTLQILGEHHIGNALAAATSAILVGIPPDIVAQRLTNAKLLSPHRMAVTDRPDGIMVIDDAYNANPESMRAALQTLAKVAHGSGRRSVAIIGQMRELGEDETSELHAEIGRLAVRFGIDKLLVVGPGAKAAHDSAVQEGSWDGESEFFADLAAVRARLPQILRGGDIVLVKASNGSKLWELGDELAAGDYEPQTSDSGIGLGVREP
ncbi:MAG: UDP-N-acetylmuramoyl-tripeptide--D-alanyl-D-alanine ligase, partial [Cellulomonadaceae bacterium]|nr:UDP-N-acetylmuramoyl-tripeptide--D-alanyl-D-alanine ligase [Cellulomonadaceae bacterium]